MFRLGLSILLVAFMGCSDPAGPSVEVQDDAPDTGGVADVDAADTRDGDPGDTAEHDVGDPDGGDASDADVADLDLPDAQVGDVDARDTDIADADLPDVEAGDADDVDADVRDDAADGDLPDADVPDPDVADADVPDADVGDAEVDVADVADADAPDTDVAPDVPGEESGLDERPPNPTCLAPPRPVGDAQVQLEPAYPALRFSRPVTVRQAPGDNTRWFVVEQSGTIVSFENREDVQQTQPFADLRDRVSCCGERGLLGLAFHPDFPARREVFLNYSHPHPIRGHVSRVSRFGLVENELRVDEDSEEVLLEIEQPYTNHNGGNLEFGPDGHLYIGLGDGGSGGDPLRHGQNLQSLLGAMLRIDVDGGDPYGIPEDNPFADGEDGLPEIYAWGLRNPWKYSFDTETGELWVADVGQNLLEEVGTIELGGNYGWNVKEGSACYRNNPLCDEIDAIDPIAEYLHEGRASVTGGYVYRGEDIPALVGSYLYADYVFGTLWGLFPDEGRLVPRELIPDAGFAISAFAQDLDGEVYVVRYNSTAGRMYRLVPVEDPEPDAFPQLLSETGCMDLEVPWQFGGGVIPYDINVPFWSDGAVKERGFAVPDGTEIAVREDGSFDFPAGSVLLKTFRLRDRLVSTRLLVRHDDGRWAGYVYRWREDETDAELLPAGRTEEIGEVEWRFPSRAACLQCHNDAAGFALGPEVRQLDREFDYPGERTANQLSTYLHVGLVTDLVDVPPLPRTDGDEPLEDRARAYLHANCAYCHRPEGPGRGPADFRMGVPLDEAGYCDITPEEGDLGLDDPRILAPGDPDRSVLWLRMRAFDATRMPSALSTELDTDGLELLNDWISGREDCP